MKSVLVLPMKVRGGGDEEKEVHVELVQGDGDDGGVGPSEVGSLVGLEEWMMERSRR